MSSVPRFTPGPGLKLVEGVVVSQMDGSKVVGHCAECPECGSIGFVIYWAEEEVEAHLQCIDCGMGYCMGHNCAHKEDTA